MIIKESVKTAKIKAPAIAGAQTVDKEAVDHLPNRLFSRLLVYNIKNYNKNMKKETFFVLFGVVYLPVSLNSCMQKSAQLSSAFGLFHTSEYI